MKDELSFWSLKTGEVISREESLLTYLHVDSIRLP